MNEVFFSHHKIVLAGGQRAEYCFETLYEVKIAPKKCREFACNGKVFSPLWIFLLTSYGDRGT
jgi:hypothetical protein